MRPGFVSLIGFFYLFLSVTLLLSLFHLSQLSILFEPKLNRAHALLFINENVLRVAVAAFLLVVSYGILSLKKWGYRALMIYSVYLSLAGLYMYTRTNEVIFMGNVLFNALIVYILKVNREFFVNHPR